MREYFTDAIVLGVRPYGEFDRTIDFYTKELGRIEARIISGRRFTSKLSPHCVLGNKVSVRLVHKNQFIVADALTETPFLKNKKIVDIGFYTSALNLFFLIKSLCPLDIIDLNLWHRLNESLSAKTVNYIIFLKICGYDPRHAICDGCGNKHVNIFMSALQVFVCDMCFPKYNDSNFIYLNHSVYNNKNEQVFSFRRAL